MKTQAASGALLATLAVVASCSAPSHSGVLTQVRDSAGVRIVTHTVDGSPLPTLREIGRNHLLAVVLDEFDVPYVRRYPLTLPE